MPPHTQVDVQGEAVFNEDVVRRLQQAGERMWPRMADHEWASRAAGPLSPLTFPRWTS